MTKTGTKFLTVVADDYGYHEAVNSGIEQTIAAGIVRSVSVMIDRVDQKHLRRIQKHHPETDLGLHLIIPKNASPPAKTLPLFLFRAFKKQVRSFVQKTGILPSNMSIHHGHSVRQENMQRLLLPLHIALAQVEKEVGIPTRDKLADVIIPFTAEATLKQNLDKLRHIFTRVQPGKTILITHPAKRIQPKHQHVQQFRSSYPLVKREAEGALLTNPLVLSMLTEEHIHIVSLANRSR